MLTNFETEMSAYISSLKQAGCSAGIIDSNRRCYESLHAYLLAKDFLFTMETALHWLETRRPDWSNHSYCAYRNSLFRFEKYLINGDISRTACFSIEQFSCRDTALKLPKQLYARFCEFKSVLNTKLCGTNVYKYSQGSKEFLLFLAEQGIKTSSEITLLPIIKYSPKFQGMSRSQRGQVSAHLAGVVNLLTYLAECGDIPYCYSKALYQDTALSLSLFHLEKAGAAFHPSKQIEPIAQEFLASLDDMRYSKSSKQLYRNDLTNFCLFLELNHLEYSRNSISLWAGLLTPGILNERKRHTLFHFDEFMKTGSSVKTAAYTWKPYKIDSLPDWSRNIILSFIADRQREGFTKSTLAMCRCAGYRFFKFLDYRGIHNPNEISPALVKEFHNTEKHSTPESKNAYGIKVRQLLSYMADQNLVPTNLFLAISTQCAPRQNIVGIMSDEMVSAVYRYRAKATAPLELRNSAIVMLGLRMGIRASDIVNLKIGDFNWQKRTLSFIQKKTRKAITLHVPTDAGNSVYRYIMEGRPQSGTKGEGYVFIRHFAPFDGMTSAQPCRSALKDVLSEYGLMLPGGQGFHITRRTFATNLLVSKNSIDDISNALGHAMHETAEVYLARDEEGMLLCPLPFESVVSV